MEVGRCRKGFPACHPCFMTSWPTPYLMQVLDEPTNHLDIPSKETLEEALQAFQGELFPFEGGRDMRLCKRLSLRWTNPSDVCSRQGQYQAAQPLFDSCSLPTISQGVWWSSRMTATS